MNAVLSIAASAVMQLALFALVPLITYRLTRKQFRGFFTYVGLTVPTVKGVLLALGLPVVGVLAVRVLPDVFASDAMREWQAQPNEAANQVIATGATGSALIIALLIKATIQTAFAEEILFRGFFAKIFVRRFGLQAGNAVQALLFGGIHAAFPWLAGMSHALFFSIAAFVSTAFFAWVACYSNEVQARGSIVPGYVAHAVGNAVSYLARLP